MNAWAFRLRPIADFLRHKTPSRLGWGALASIPGLALAGPSGENVVAGGAVVSRPNATHTQVDQSTARAVVNWSTFSVDSDEYVVFNQPGATASILNRVVGANESQIFGQINANGRVFLVNPQGVYFAPGARVDAAALTASVMDITDNNFMSGNYVFSRPANAPDGATVENAGQINVSDGGFVVLAGDYANNSGVVSARLGSVVLAAGSQMTLDLNDDGLVSFAVDEATVSNLAGANNSGQILADGGQIIMTAKVANDLVATAVNNDGLLQARRIVADGGEIYLAAAGADIVQAGTIDAAGENGQSGGEVNITGDADITLTADSRINANGSGAGNGGTVNVIADGTMAFRRDAEISARAGAEGGRGGTVELSGHENIHVRGELSLGQGGQLLIDPATVQLQNDGGSYGGSYGTSGTVDVGYIADQLNDGVDVFVIASDTISASSMATSVNATSLGSGVSVAGDLTLKIGLSSVVVASNSFSISPDSSGNIDLAGVDFNILGDFTASAGTFVGDVNLGKVTASNVVIKTGGFSGGITLNTGGITAASNTLSLSAADDINIGTMTNPGGLSLVGDDVGITVTTGGNLNVRGDIFASATNGTADIIVTAVGDIAAQDVTVIATGDSASIDLIALIGDITVNNVHASNVSGSAAIEMDAFDISVNDVTAIASSSVSVRFAASNDLVINGITNVSGSSSSQAIDTPRINYNAGNDVSIADTINATLTGCDISAGCLNINAGNDIFVRSMDIDGGPSGDVNVRLFATGDINVGTAANPALWDITGPSVGVYLQAGNTIGNNINVFGTLNFTATTDFADVHFSADNDVNFGNATVAGNVNVHAGSGIHLSFSAASGNVNVNGTVDASATDGSASVDVRAGVDVKMKDLIVYGTSGADIDISAGRDIVTRDVEAEIGSISISTGGGPAVIDFNAGRNITARKVEAVAGANFGRASIDFSTSNGKITVTGDATAEAFGATGSGSYGGSARIGFDAATGIDAKNVAAMANSGSATIELDTTSGNITTQGLKAISQNKLASVDIEGNVLSTTLTVGGAVEVSGTSAVFSASAFNINLNGDVSLTASSDIDFWADADNNLVLNGDLVANEAGGGEVEVDLFAANSATINGDVMITAGADSEATLGIGTDIKATSPPNNTVTVNGNLSVVSGMRASALIYGRNVNVPGNVTIRGAGTTVIGDDIELAAELAIWAVNNVNVSGDVLVRNTNGDAGGDAGAQVLFGGDAVFGKFEVAGGAGGWGALVNVVDPMFGVTELPPGFVPGSKARFNKLTKASGGAGGAITVDVRNELTTGPNSILEAVSENGPATVILTGDVNSATINVGGAVNVEGTMANFSASAFDINLNGNFDLVAPSYISMYAEAKNNLVVNGNIDANEAGGGFVDVALWGKMNTTINGAVNLVGGAGSYVYLNIGADEEAATPPVNNVIVNGNVSVMSGMLANATYYGRNVTAPGKITVKGSGMPTGGGIAAGLGMWAVNNLNVSGDVLVSNPTGNAGTQYIFGGDATIGKHIVNGGTNGWGVALFNATDPAGLAALPQGFVRGRTMTFNKLLDTNGGAGSRAVVDVQNSIVTGPNGLIDAKFTEFTTRANGTTNMDLKTRTMAATLKNLGQTPNVRYDNRAFIGPSSVNFNSGTVLKAATFFANGSLTFNGGFTASNLAVAVTNGTVTFGAPVNITGATPFLPTAPDLSLFNLMGQRGLLPPNHGPNVQIFAQQGININQPFNVGGPSPFTKMLTNGPFNISGLTTSASNLLAVFSPIDTTRPIFFEDEPYLQPSGASAFFNFPTISGLPNNSNVTVVIGERGPAQPLLSGPFTIGARGGIDIGERNMFIITRGPVSGADTVITNGIFEVVGLAQNNVFEVPIVNEFGEEPATDDDDDDDDDDDLVLGDNEGDDGDDGGVAQEGSGSESMECS